MLIANEAIASIKLKNMNDTFTFVAHKYGDFEGRSYNNVELSDGIEKMKIKNEVPNDQLANLKRGQSVKCEFTLMPYNGMARVTLKSITPK